MLAPAFNDACKQVLDKLCRLVDMHMKNDQSRLRMGRFQCVRDSVVGAIQRLFEDTVIRQFDEKEWLPHVASICRTVFDNTYW